MKVNSREIKQKLATTLLCFSLLGGVGCSQGQNQGNAPQAIPVKLATLEEAKLIDSDQYVGTLEATKRVELAPKINGRILDIFVREGDVVNAGQIIAELEPTQQKEDVYAANANIQSRIAAYEQGSRRYVLQRLRSSR